MTAGQSAGLVASFVAPATIGWALTRLGPYRGVVPRVSLAMGLGLGVCSLVTLVLLCLGIAGRTSLVVVEGSLALLAFRIRPPADTPSPVLPKAPKWLLVATAAVAVLAAAVMLRELRLFPHGGFDASAIWNHRARCLYLAPKRWRDAFGPGAEHPDYPPLLPLAVARCWFYVGADTTAGPRGLAVVYAALCVGTLLGAIRDTCGSRPACWGLLFLLSWLFFVRHAASQYADVSLASYYLMAAVLLISARDWPHWLLAGMAAGYAAMTKNEGQMFAVVFLLVAGAWAAQRRQAKTAVPAALAGCAVFALPTLAMKLLVAGHSELLSGRGLPALFLLVSDYRRHRTILRELLAAFSSPANLPLLLLLTFGLLRRPRMPGVPAVTLLIVAFGYYCVYLITPHDLGWHLNTSLYRLIVHLWPLAVFALLHHPPSHAASGRGHADPPT